MRYLIYFAYHPAGIIEPHVHQTLDHLRAHFDHIHLVHNGPISGRRPSAADTVQERENAGFDVAAYKAALAAIPPAVFNSISELTLANYTFFVRQSLDPVFEWANQQDVDFWGISAHGQLSPNPFTGDGVLPYHLNSHWISVRSKMLLSGDFSAWWQRLPEITSYEDSVQFHESRFTDHFEKRGYRHAAYVQPTDCAYQVFDRAHDPAVPILKRRLFYHQPTLYGDINGTNPRQALENSATDPSVAFGSVMREAPPEIIYRNADLLFVVPDANFGDVDCPPIKTVVAAGAELPDLPITMEVCDSTDLGPDEPALYIGPGPVQQKEHGLDHLARDATVCFHAQQVIARPGIGLALPVLQSHGPDGEIGFAPFSTSGIAWARGHVLQRAAKADVADLPEIAATLGLATACVSNTASLPRNYVKLEARHGALTAAIGKKNPYEAQAFLHHLIDLASSEGVEKARAELAKQAHDFGFKAGFDQGFDAGFKDGWAKARRPIWRRRA